MPHNDVLIFGTETTLALDVGTNTTTGGTPSVTVGYKREEAVWMPLMANGRHAEVPPTANQLYQGQGTKDGNANGAKDAYSVFASFGAQLEGRAGSAKVGLAQFFTTGIAAQNMAENPASVLALTVKSDQQGTADAAAVQAIASPDGSDGKAYADKEKAKNDKIYACIKQHGTEAFKTAPVHLPSDLKAEYATALGEVDSGSSLFYFFENYDQSEAIITATAKTKGCTV